MQPDQMQPNGGYYTPEQMAQWQQSGMPPQMTPEMMQQMWQGQQMWQPTQPVVPLAQMTPEQVQQMQYEAYMWQMQQMQMPPMPTMQQAAPVQPVRKRKKKTSGQGGGAGAVIKMLIILAIAGGVAWFFLRNAGNTAQSTAVIEMETLGTTYSGDALIVRNETAFDDEGVQSIDYVSQEGSVVYRGDVVCYVYSTGYSTREMTTLQDYRDQIKDYQQTLLRGETAYDQRMTRLENEVIERGLEVRSLVQGARGNLGNQEAILETAITQRQAYFRSKYSSDMRLNRLYDDESGQQQRIDSWISQKVVTQDSSVVSFYTDGFEYALTPSTFEQYTPTEVRSMINGERPSTSTAARGRTNLYRLVRQNNYAVLMLIRDNTWNPVEGNTYKLVLEQFSNTVVDARVLSFTRSGGELLVRLAVIGDVTDVLYMRTCQAQIGEYVDCMVVPESALYEQNNATGVVLVTTDRQLFVPVNVLRQEGGKAYISAIQTGVITQGQSVMLFQ